MRPIHGIGPIPSQLILVGSQPGYKEAQLGIPFVGKTGDEVHRLLHQAELPPLEFWYRTNLYRVYRGEGYRYTRADYEFGSENLRTELSLTQPDLVVTLGREATNWFLGDDTLSIEDVQGIAWEVNGRTIFPVVHPAAGFRSPELASLCVAGFMALGAHFANPDAPVRTLYDDPLEGQEAYEEITVATRLAEVLHGYPADPDARLAIDTEGYPWRPFSLQFSYRPGEAYLIGADRADTLRAFGDFLRRRRPRLLFHSALHDLGMLRALALPVDDLEFDDTMVRAYLLQLEPQGLKALATRHCGMHMQSYAEIVGSVGEDLARDYLTRLWTDEEQRYGEACHAEFEARRAAGRRIRVVPKLPKSALHKAVERCLNSERPGALWHDQDESIRLSGEARFGLLREVSLADVERPRAVHYGCRDADATLRVDAQLVRRFGALDLKAAVGLHQVYQLDMRTYPLIDRMQQTGLKPDLTHFANLSARLAVEIAALQTSITAQIGVPAFNANSGDQVAAYLYDTLGLPTLKQTKGGRGSTNDKILEALEREHPEHAIIATIRQYRELYKLKSTFVDAIPDYVHRWPHDGRVHATFRTTRVVTGRLAAADPNVLAQPEHGQFAKDFKRGWVADDGHLICAWDESQIELRGLAHLSQDPTMLAVYRGELRNPDGSLIDLHAKLAQRIFGGRVEDYMQKCAGRLAAKAINFGIPMGMTNRGLSIELRKNGVDADEDDAQRWLDETLGLYVGVADYMERRIEEARRRGYIQCLSGRIRFIGGIRSRDDRVREEAERFAFSTPVQESAQFIMKQAEAQVWTLLKEHWRRGDWVEPLLQVHDCLKLECEERLAQTLHREMTVAMTQVSKGFCVPLAVEGEYGPNMADMVGF